MEKQYILGISAFYHDSAAALICNGEILSAAQEERFTRKKHDARFPKQAISYCLKNAGISVEDLALVGFYDRPSVKFDRIFKTYLAYAPSGFSSFKQAMPVWLKEKLFLESYLRKSLSDLGGILHNKAPEIRFTDHHQSHAASAFFPSPFKKASVLCLDGVGEWATTTVWDGQGSHLRLKWEMDFPHSLGLLYSAFTDYAGFKVNSGEYKLMGLAPYGEPEYAKLILDHLIDLKDDGTFRLDLSYFSFPTGHSMTNDKFHALFNLPPRAREGKLDQRHMNIASSIQAVTEEIVLRLGKTIHREQKNDFLCMAGGVALNCVANGRLLRDGPFRDIWIQPAAGDAGGAVGAALGIWHASGEARRKRVPCAGTDKMQGAYLGPEFTNEQIKTGLDEINASYRYLPDDELFAHVAQLIDTGNVIGWFQGRMEFGPRALGNRSIIGDARNSEMQTKMNLKIKYRESFRPFAPAVLSEDVAAYFQIDRASPYMLLVANVNEELRLPLSTGQRTAFGIEKLKIPRSTIPAVTHIDYSARIQTVHKETNPRFHRLLEEFRNLTGVSTIVNTSFNVRGEPIVCSPEDAYRCFMRTEMDYLVMQNFVLEKKNQPTGKKTDDWKSEFELD